MEYFKNPRTQYERFVNAFAQHERGKYGSTEELGKKAADKWKEFNEKENFHETVELFIASAPKPKYRQTKLSFSRVASSPSATEEKSDISIVSTSTPGTITIDEDPLPQQQESVPDVLLSDSSQHTPAIIDARRVASFLMNYCPSLHTEDVMNNYAFVSTFAPSAAILGEFITYLVSYKSEKQRRTKTKLYNEMCDISNEIEDFKCKMKKASDISISLSLGTSQLSLQASKKCHLLTELVAIATTLTQKIESTGLLKRVKKRLYEIDVGAKTNFFKKLTTPEMVVKCRNSDVPWATAYSTFEATGGKFVPKSFDVTKIRYAAEQIENETFVAFEQLCVSVNGIKREELIEILITNFPIMCVARGEQSVFIDIHELLLNGNAFVALLNGENPIAQNDTEANDSGSRDEEVHVQTFGPHRKSGRQPLHEKYPQLVSEVTSFIKQHSFSAHGRRRETTGTGVGVTLEQIRAHVFKTIPELVDISMKTIHRLMVPPRKGTISGQSHKSLVSARIPKTGRNDYRENHENQHFLFSRVAYREEFCSKFTDECTFFSCDDMAKIRMGPTTAVSRYHQERRFFEVGDEPNLPDHDTPNPGYLINCSGYQQLVVNVAREKVVDDKFSADDRNDLLNGAGFVLTDEHSDEVQERSSGIPTYCDKLGRLHYCRYMSGPTKLVLRSVKFSPSNSMNHVNDLLPELDALASQGIGVVFLKVDNGGDWNLANLVNQIYFCRLWKRTKLDVLGIVSYAARFSAYNNIEHTWAPMSKKLTSVILPSVLPGDEAEPYKLDISHDEIQQKEAELFDNAMKLITDKYWSEAEFNGSEVTALMEPSLLDSYPYNDFKSVHDLIMGPYSLLIKDVSMMAELRFLFNHIDKKSNEVIFQKCHRPTCSHCTSIPIIAGKAWEALKGKEFKWPNPTPSESFPGHYKTFLEIDVEHPSSYITRDEGLPNSLKVGDCPFCPFMFMSAAERDKHLKVFHRDCKQRDPVQHKCLHIIKENKSSKRCNLIFNSIHALRQHKKLVGHTRKRKQAKIVNNLPKKIPSRKNKSSTNTPSNGFSSSDTDESEARETDESESDEGVNKSRHDCTGTVNKNVDENTCYECQGAWGPGAGDWDLCSACHNWFHAACF